MTFVQLFHMINKRLLVHDPLSKLIVVCIDAGSLFLFSWKIETVNAYWTANRRWALELVRRERSVMFRLFFLFKPNEKF